MFCVKDTVVLNKTIEKVTNRQYICRKIRLKCHVIAFSTNPTKWEELKNSKSEHAWCNCLHVCTAKVWNVRWLANLWRNVYLTPEHMSPTRHGVHWANHFLSCGIHEFWPFFCRCKNIISNHDASIFFLHDNTLELILAGHFCFFLDAFCKYFLWSFFCKF